MNRFVFLITLICILAVNLSCKKASTEPSLTATLSVEDVSCTEAWVKITSANFQNPSSLALFVDDKPNQSITLVSSDTVLYVDSLLPSRSYKIKAVFATNNRQQTTNEVIAKTMDTTNHNFTWQTFTFGEHSSSTLYDVAIINENNIWAVGEIYMKDSLGNPDPIAYNAAHWNGSKWEVKKISVLYKGNQTVAPLEGVFALPTGEIIFSSGLPYLPQTGGWKLYHLWDMGVLNQNDGGVNKIWGTSINDLYFVGRKGTIVHYDGKSWKKIDSGTTLDINDIWGDYNKRTQEWEILAVAANKFLNEGSTLLKIEKTIAKELNKVGLPWSLSSVWFQSSKNYFIGGDGLFSNKKINNDWTKVTDFPTFYKDRVRGLGSNDIVISGSNGLLSHFNGFTWRHYQNSELPYFTGRFLSAAIKNDIIVAVGWENQRSIITLGRR